MIKQDTVIIEPTSGNTGIALAFVAAAKGYRLDPHHARDHELERASCSRLGAELVLTPGAEGMKGAIDKAESLPTNTPNSFIPQQFNNPANPEIHRKTTAEEIWEDTEGKVDILVGRRGHRRHHYRGRRSHQGTQALVQGRGGGAAIPRSSPGGSPGPHKIQGIGAGFVPDVLNTGHRSTRSSR